jgi:3'-5' exoribonuclease
MKTKFINELQAGEELVDDFFAVKNVTNRTANNGQNFRSLVLSDKTGEINAKIWESSLLKCQNCQVGEVVCVNASVEEYKGKKQLIVKDLKIQPENEIDLTDFINTTPKDISGMFDFLTKTIDSIQNENLKKLISLFFKDKSFIEKIKKAPGAQMIHHAYLGGLLEHIVEMLKFSEPLICEFPELDADLLKAGIILHDVGKMDELEIDASINRTTTGYLCGHLMLGVEQVSRQIDKVKNFPLILKNQLIHMLLSHHGLLEFGSPVKPMTVEAWALHLLDQMSSKMNTAYQKMLETKNQGVNFSEHVFSLDNRIFVADQGDSSDNSNTLF